MNGSISASRRTVLSAGAAGALSALIARTAEAAAPTADAKLYPTTAFAAKNEAAALKLLFGKTPKASGKIDLGAPQIAENGAVVPVTMASSLPNVTAMALLSLENPYTLACAYRLAPGTQPHLSSRLKLAKTTKVVAVVESNGALYRTSRMVKVTLGGCG
ncbi:MAG: thiosulfate oxidation carrier protein SoxY [Acetobacteraceae bacterium]